jgi:hypothetical protein
MYRAPGRGLRDVGAPLDLAWQAAALSQQFADRLDDPLVGALAAFGTTHGLLAAGAFDLARTRLEAALAAVLPRLPNGWIPATSRRPSDALPTGSTTAGRWLSCAGGEIRR